MSATLVEELRQHRIRQAQELLKFGVRLSDDTFVVARADGTPYCRITLRRPSRSSSPSMAWKRVRLHDLRHTHATAMLKAGVHGKIVQERLGRPTRSLS
jgi:integrase